MTTENKSNTRLVWNVLIVLIIAEILYLWYLVDNKINGFSELTPYAIINMSMMVWIVATLYIAFSRLLKTGLKKVPAVK